MPMALASCSRCREHGHNRRSCPKPKAEQACGTCGSRDFDPTHGRCRPCERRRMKARRDALIEHHQCTDCTAPLRAGAKGRLCARCRVKEADRARESYNELKATGVCPKCGGERDDPRWVMCGGCRAIGRERHQQMKLKGIE